MDSWAMMCEQRAGVYPDQGGKLRVHWRKLRGGSCNDWILRADRQELCHCACRFFSIPIVLVAGQSLSGAHL